MCVEVDAGSLAVPLALVTVLALVGIDVYLEKRLLANQSEQCTDRTNGVAPSTSAPPSQHSDDAPGEQGNDKGRNTLDPDIHFV